MSARPGGSAAASRLPRLVALGGVLLVVGGVLAVVVAWACAGWSPTMPVRNTPLEPAHAAWWARRAPEGFGPRPAGFTQARVGFGVEHLRLWAKFPRPVRRNPDASVQKPQRRLRAGWPLPALEGVVWQDGSGTRRPEHILRVTAGAGELPLRPLWPGLLVDTALFSWTLVTLGAVPLVTRRVWRRLRRRCPACGYPAGDSDVCTECGARLPGR